MSTTHHASVYVKNTSDGDARITLTHQNDSNGTQWGTWAAKPGEVVGPLTVVFETGFGTGGILDWWTVSLVVANGSRPGIYLNSGTAAFPHWKECQLQQRDVDQNLYFQVSTSQFSVNLASAGCGDAMSKLAEYSPITNVFVLMLENRSFDHIFGASGIPGLTVPAAGASNSYKDKVYRVASPAPTSLTSDPGHEFCDTVLQLTGQAGYPVGGPYPPITMKGFAASYATVDDEGLPAPDAAHIGDVMLEYAMKAQLPTSYALATNFAVCDHWFSSMPGPTWPNRMFVHAASSAGLDHSPTTAEIIGWEFKGFTFPRGSIYQRLASNRHQWRIYNDNTDAYSDDPGKGSTFGAIPQVTALQGVTIADVNSLTNFAEDLEQPYPYQYTFIEPNYGDITADTYVGGSSQHPMDDVYGGEGLIKAVYEAIRNSPLWASSLLVITYDEHGGFYDHLPPPAAPPPNDGSGFTYNKSHFPFDLYGVRVPAIVVSPLIAAKSVDHTVYDHSSIIATVERLYGLSPMTGRDSKANDLRRLLTTAVPRTDCPTVLPPPVRPAPRPRLSAEEQAAEELLPVSDKGSLPAFLGLAVKAAYESYATTEDERALVDAEYAAIRTRGDARAFLGRVTAKVDRLKLSQASTEPRR